MAISGTEPKFTGTGWTLEWEHENFSVSTTAIPITLQDPQRSFLEITNTHATETVFLAFGAVADTTDGYHLLAGKSIRMDENAGTGSQASIFAIAVTGPITVSVLTGK